MLLENRVMIMQWTVIESVFRFCGNHLIYDTRCKEHFAKLKNCHFGYMCKHLEMCETWLFYFSHENESGILPNNLTFVTFYCDLDLYEGHFPYYYYSLPNINLK